MQVAPILKDETTRLEALHRLAILDTKPEERFDEITREAVEKLKIPISMVSIIDKDREWFKSCVGVDQKEGARSVSFCGHALMAKNLFIVNDTTKDERFFDNPMVISFPYIRFYAGVALLDNKTGQPIGVFCVKDDKPREFSVDEVSILMDLASRAEKELNRKV